MQLEDAGDAELSLKGRAVIFEGRQRVVNTHCSHMPGSPAVIVSAHIYHIGFWFWVFTRTADLGGRFWKLGYGVHTGLRASVRGHQ